MSKNNTVLFKDFFVVSKTITTFAERKFNLRGTTSGETPTPRY